MLQLAKDWCDGNRIRFGAVNLLDNAAAADCISYWLHHASGKKESSKFDELILFPRKQIVLSFSAAQNVLWDTKFVW